MAEEKKARPREISDGLLRQRRNLLLSTLVMPLFFVSGAEITKINVLGTNIELANPESVKYLLIALFLYFFLRYWQYYKEESYIVDMHRKIQYYSRTKEVAYLTKKAQEKSDFIKSIDFHVSFTDPAHNRWGQPVRIPKVQDTIPFLFMRECRFIFQLMLNMDNNYTIYLNFMMTLIINTYLGG